jgi:hypothetical protein
VAPRRLDLLAVQKRLRIKINLSESIRDTGLMMRVETYNEDLLLRYS